MMVSNRGSSFGLIRWQARNVGVFFVVSTVVVVLHELHRWFALPRLFEVPALPVAVVGGAIGIFVSFRSNAGYERWWEGRRLWGSLVNSSRHWATQVLVYVPDRGVAEALVRRQIAYVHLLRVLLRGQSPAADPEVRRWLGDGTQGDPLSAPNPPHALLHAQLATLAARGDLSELRLQSLDRTVRELLEAQGGCERIKRTPVPRAYGFIAEQLVWFYAILLPLAIVESLVWLTIPVTVLVCLSFVLIGEAGRVLEDPFTLFWNGLPLDAICRTIENDLRHRLGETDLPGPLQPDADGILM